MSTDRAAMDREMAVMRLVHEMRGEASAVRRELGEVVDDDDAVYSGTAPTEAEAWREAMAAGPASPVGVARAEGVTAGLDAMRARAEAAEARAAQAESDARLMLPMCLLSRGGMEMDDLSPPEWSGLGLLLQRFHAAPREDIAAAVRRILASVTL